VAVDRRQLVGRRVKDVEVVLGLHEFALFYLSHRTPVTNIDTSADISSALVSTYIDTSAEPVLSLLYLLILFSSLLYLYWAPLPTPLQPDRSPINPPRSAQELVGVVAGGQWGAKV
jgi:hypothetical protein